MTATQQEPKSDQRDLESLNDRIRHTEQIIARLREQMQRRQIHLANLQYARGQIVNRAALDTLNVDRPALPALSLSNGSLSNGPIHFTADERDHFTAREARRLAEEGGCTIDASTSQLPADFVDNDHDGHG